MPHRISRARYPNAQRSFTAALAFSALSLTLGAVPRALQAQLFSQADLVTDPGFGVDGADFSAVQTSLGLVTQGYTSNPALFRVADDFSVTGNSWDISGFRFFGWQANSGTTSPFNFAAWQLWDARPGEAGANVVAGDITANAISATGFTGIYRGLETSPKNAVRPVMFVDAAANLTLGPGDYWLEWVIDEPSKLGFIPAVTISGQANTGNALRFNVIPDTWFDVEDGDSPQGMPFQIFGSVAGSGAPVPEPEVLSLLGISAALLLVAMRRRRTA